MADAEGVLADFGDGLRLGRQWENDAAVTIIRLMQSLDAIAEWLQAVGYGVDYVNSEHAVPEVLRLPLAKAWWKADNSGRETVEDYVRMLKDEGAW